MKLKFERKIKKEGMNQNKQNIKNKKQKQMNTTKKKKKTN